MKIKVSSKINSKSSLLIVPLFKDKKYTKNTPKSLEKLLKNREKNKDFKGKEGDCLLLVPDTATLPKKVILVGLGTSSKLSAAKARNMGAKIAKTIQKHQQNEAEIYFPGELSKFSQSFSEGMALANYNPAKYQTGKAKKDNEKKQIKSVSIVPAKTNANLKKELQKGIDIAEAVNQTRDLVNGPNNFINADSLSKIARQIAKDNKYKVKIIDKKELQKLKMGALLGVNLGSDYSAKMVVFEYKPAKAKKEPPIILLGKGITFDSGGYNLKPTSAITNMKEDMAGAAVVFGVFRLLKKLNIQHHIIGITPLTDNLIGSKAQKVNDIVTSYSGKTIEITNTDAEGRLVLADAISYGIDKYKPRFIVDLATLTGACMVALGDRYAGLFGNDDKLIEKMQKSGQTTDEQVWHLPIHEDYRKKMKGKIADLQNSEGSGLAGASKAAAFLENFVDKTKWLHLDIAGVTFVKDPKPYDYEAATGYGVRLLVDFLETNK